MVEVDFDQGVSERRKGSGWRSSTCHQADVTADGELAGLLKSVEQPVVVYFALPPSITEKVCDLLKPDDLPENSRFVMERLFGSRQESVRKLSKALEMSFFAMDEPATLGEKDVRDRIAAVLRAAEVGADYSKTTRRARYTAGKIGNREVPNYVDGPGVDGKNNTETLAEIAVHINNSRWSGVTFILCSGKSVAENKMEAIVTFKPLPHLPNGFTGTATATGIRMGLGPAELQLDIDVNGPGDIYSLDRAELKTALNDTDLLPYGEVFKTVLTVNAMLSVRGDTAVECWRVLEPVVKAWAKNDVPLEEHAAGSHGPKDWETSREDTPL